MAKRGAIGSLHNPGSEADNPRHFSRLSFTVRSARADDVEAITSCLRSLRRGWLI
jgi:hypothetical protein